MFSNFERFGHIELDTSEIFCVLWEWKQGTIDLPSGLTDFGDTDVLQAVGLLFKNGSQLKIEGKDAKLFREWWVSMTAPVGEIA